ncbi:methylamine utilization protein [Alteromonadaceae bacterium M269]|nr:methylamine utilization protein [Alteromonadaceae bacterium M269]
MFLRSTVLLISLLVSPWLDAYSLSVEVLTKKDSKLVNAVVYLTSEQPLPPKSDNSVAHMDQINSQFVPHILVVQRDTLVDFPNSDSIKHHVYSFSPAKTFELQLYKDQQPEAVAFDKEGRVEMGCNVHDWMLGYIYVVDTPYFGKTDENGRITLDVPAGEYTVHVRNPRIKDDESTLVQKVNLTSNQNITFKLKKKLLPSLELYEESDEFSTYE